MFVVIDSASSVLDRATSDAVQSLLVWYSSLESPIDLEELRQPSRARKGSRDQYRLRVRWVLMYVVSSLADQQRAARFLGCDHTTVAYGLEHLSQRYPDEGPEVLAYCRAVAQRQARERRDRLLHATTDLGSYGDFVLYVGATA